MSHKTVIVTGADANFFKFLNETLGSLDALKMRERADIGILDLGLTAEQISELKSRGYTVKTPEWTIPVPTEMRKQVEIGYIARTALRDYFPGYSVYLWFDADAWAQTDEFFDAFVNGALAKGAAIVRENGVGMKRNYIYNRWWYGHMIMSHGFIHGIKTAFPPAINTGLVALTHNAPHWELWIKAFTKMIEARRRNNLDQHSFNAALMIHNLPATLISARCNWICTLSPPIWDEQRRLFCEPDAQAKPLSVLHLAGPAKRRDYQLKDRSGKTVVTPVSYDESAGLRQGKLAQAI